jgi:hypothetical protein
MIETTGKQQRHGQNGQLALKWGIPTKVVYDGAWPGESLCFLNREKHFPALRTQDAAKVSVGQYGGPSMQDARGIDSTTGLAEIVRNCSSVSSFR